MARYRKAQIAIFIDNGELHYLGKVSALNETELYNLTRMWYPKWHLEIHSEEPICTLWYKHLDEADSILADCGLLSTDNLQFAANVGDKNGRYLCYNPQYDPFRDGEDDWIPIAPKPVRKKTKKSRRKKRKFEWDGRIRKGSDHT